MRSQGGKLFYAWNYPGPVLAKQLPDDYGFLETLPSLWADDTLCLIAMRDFYRLFLEETITADDTEWYN